MRSTIRGMQSLQAAGLLVLRFFGVLWSVVATALLQLADASERIGIDLNWDWRFAYLIAGLLSAFTLVVLLWRDVERYRRRDTGEEIHIRKEQLLALIREQPTEENYGDWESRAGAVDHSIDSYIRKHLPRRFLNQYRHTDDERVKDVGDYLTGTDHYLWKLKLLNRIARIDAIVDEIGCYQQHPRDLKQLEFRRAGFR